MDKLYHQIIDIYKETGSVKETAERLGTYPIKVRRVLITEGMWESKTSIQIGELLEQNMTVAQISERLVMSEKNVQSYMPYSRGQYGGENRSSDAVRSEEYRGRQHVAAQNQVTRSEARKRKQEPGVQEELQEQRQLLEELQKEKKRLQDEKREIWDQIEREKKRIPMALQLHLELDMEYVTEGEKEILHRYGRMENSISRDFILKEDETPTSIGGELRQFCLGGSPISFQDKASGGSQRRADESSFGARASRQVRRRRT